MPAKAPLEYKLVKRYLRSCVVAGQGNITNSELKAAYERQVLQDLPFNGFDNEFYQAMDDCDCVCINGRWRAENLNKNTANVLTNLSKMEDKKGKGAKFNKRIPVRESSTAYSKNRIDSTIKHRNWPANNDNREERGGNDMRYNNDYVDSDQNSYRGEYMDNRREEVSHHRPANDYSTNDNYSESGSIRQHIYNNFNPDSDEDSDDDDFTPPGLVPGAGYRYTNTNSNAEHPTEFQSTSQNSRSSSATPSQQTSRATFFFPPATSSKDTTTSTLKEQENTDDGVPYDKLCNVVVELFVHSWPDAMTADELMNNLAKQTKLRELVGPNLKEHHEKLINMVQKNEECIFVETIDGEKVYSYIPGAPDAENEADLFNQVGKMLCLILHTYDDMSIESAQSRLGLPDNGQFTKLNGIALIMEAARLNEQIIVGRSGHTKDKKLSLKYGTSVVDFRSQVRIFPKSADVINTNQNAFRSQEEKISDLISECENFISDDFPLYRAHPLAELGPASENEPYKGTLVYYSTLDKFTVRISNDLADYEKMQSCLVKEYEGIEWDEILLNYVKEGAAVAVRLENGKYARGIVNHYERNPNEPSLVNMIDDACIDEVPVSSLFPLKDYLKDKHPLGIRCTIGAFRTNPEKLEKYFDEHRAIWKTLNLVDFIEILPKTVVACGGKMEVVVDLTFTAEDGEQYCYPKDVIDNNIIKMI